MSTSLDQDPRYDATREIRAPRGSQLNCKSWLTEAAYRMIQNNLDAEVAENPKHLVVYGGKAGKRELLERTVQEC